MWVVPLSFLLLGIAGNVAGLAGVAAQGGSSWSVVPSPNPNASFGVPYNVLEGVSCLSASACIAVGGGNGAGTLAESWNGTNWVATERPVHGDGLSGVSCISSSHCFAVGVGYGGSSPGPETLVELWNGTTWSVIPSPSPGTSGSFLSGVSCVSASDCTAVGYYQDANVSYPFGAGETLVESWDGSTWSVIPSPSPGTSGSVLNGVSCVSATVCMAVGASWSVPGTGPGSLTESWDGTTWSVIPSPDPNPFNNVLNGVSCISANACIAVGEGIVQEAGA